MVDHSNSGIDTQSLVKFLTEQFGTVDRYEVEEHDVGHSNETIFVTWGNQELVLRKPPTSEKADTAHDMGREYTIYDALQGTEVPVPTTLLYCDDSSVIGAPFFLMERIYGDVFNDDEPDGYSAVKTRQKVSYELIDSLAAIHNVDYDAVGLSSLGSPEGYVERQIKRWTKQLEWSMSKEVHDRELPSLNRLQEWLTENQQTTTNHSLVHGDYKFNNVMFRQDTDVELAAVFDWEMGTLGDPLVDLGWLLCFWWDQKDPPVDTPAYTPGFMRKDGYLTREELVERYEQKSGIDFEHEQFYRALGIYKIAVIGEMFYVRYRQGSYDDPFYKKMEEYVPALAERGIRIIEDREPL